MLDSKKIIVVGCPGSGKSYFSSVLSMKTNITHYSLDNIWWKPDRTHISRDEFDRKIKDIFKLEEWILDGDYSRTYEIRIRECEMIVFLDFDEHTCMQGILDRIGRERIDMPWVEHNIDPELIESVKRYKDNNRMVLYDLFSKYPDKELIVFKTRDQSDTWLYEL